MIPGALNYVEFRAAMHPTWCMAERVGCAQSPRSLRLPSVAEPIPLPKSGKGSHPTEYSCSWLASRSLGAGWRRGWDSNPRLLSGEPLFESGALNHSATSPYYSHLLKFFPHLHTAMPLRGRGWDVLGHFVPSASPSGRRTHVSLCSVTPFLPPPP